MLTSRFHPHLLSARSGATCIFYANSLYYHFKHQSILTLGSGFGDGIAGEPPQANRLAARDAILVAQKRTTADAIYATRRSPPRSEM